MRLAHVQQHCVCVYISIINSFFVRFRLLADYAATAVYHSVFERLLKACPIPVRLMYDTAQLEVPTTEGSVDSGQEEERLVLQSLFSFGQLGRMADSNRISESLLWQYWGVGGEQQQFSYYWHRHI
jgi:hypothetical protein